jgi:hypothetical protein
MLDTSVREISGGRAMRGRDLRENNGGNVVIAGSAFVLGLLTGLFVNGVAKQMRDSSERLWHRHDDDTVISYDNNLPDSLERREPAPHPGQPRFGGTGALGVSPEAVMNDQSGESGNRE